MKKRLMSLLLTAAMVMSMIVVPAAAEDAPIKLSVNTTPASAQPGEIIDVAISLEDTEAERMYTALEFKLNFDPEVLSPVNQASRPPKQYAVLGTWAGQDASFGQNYPSGTNYISVAIGHGYGVVGTGDIVTMKFEVLKDVSKADSALDLDVTYAAYAVYDEDFNLLETVDIVKNGELSVTDGSVNVIYPVTASNVGAEQNTLTTATLSGSYVKNVDTANVTEVGFVYDTEKEGSYDSSVKADAVSENFSAVLTGETGKTYYYKSYVVADGVTYYCAAPDAIDMAPARADEITFVDFVDTISVPSQTTYSVSVADQFGNPFDAEIVWDLNTELKGMSIDAETGNVRVTKDTLADADKSVDATGTATITATVKGTEKSVSKEITINREASKVASIVITPVAKVNVPTKAEVEANGAVKVEMEATGEDQYGDIVPVEATWSINGAEGVTIEGNVISISNTAETGEIPVTATYNGISATYTLSINRALADVAAIEISGAETGTIKAAEDVTLNYSALVFNQFGGEMTADLNWAVSDSANVSIADGVLTVNKGAAECEVIISAARGNVKSNEITVKLTREPAVVAEVVISTDNNAPVILPAKAATEAVEVKFDAKVIANFPDVTLTPDITWNVDSDSVTINDGVLSVTKDAAVGTVNVTATAGGIMSNSIAVEIKKADSVATSIEMPADATMSIPTGEEANTKQFAATVKDQYGEIMNAEVSYIFATADDFVTADNNTVTVKMGATADKAYTLTAKCGNLEDSMTITVVDIDIDWASVNAQANANAVYGQTWGQIVTFVNGDFASLDGVKVPGTFTLVDADKIPNAGEQQFVIRFESTDGQYTVDNVYTATIAPKSINAIWTNYTNLVYTGEPMNVTASVAVEGVNVTVTGGDAVNVNAEGYTAKATIDNTNYVLANPEQVYSIAKANIPNHDAISAQQLSINKAKGGNDVLIAQIMPELKAYDFAGSELTGTVTLKRDVTELALGNYTMQYEFTPDSANFNSFTDSFALEITEGEPQNIQISDKTVTYGDAAFEHKVVDNKTDKIAYAVVSGDAVSVDAETGMITVLKAGQATLKVTVEGDDVYASASLEYTITVDPKTVEVAGIKILNKVYDGTTNAQIDTENSQITVVGIVGTDEVTVDISNADADFSDANVNDGIAVSVTGLALDNTNYTLAEGYAYTTTADITQAAEVTVSLNKATQTPGNVTGVEVVTTPPVDPAKITVYYEVVDTPAVKAGDVLTPCAHATDKTGCTAAEGEQCDHTDGCGYTVAAEDKEATYKWVTEVPQQAGTYPVKVEIKGDPNVADTIIAAEDMKLVVAASSGGGGGSITNAISVSKSENGSVSLSNKYAPKGKEITITAKPDAGYELKSITVTDAKGNDIEVSLKNGKYVFEMPATKVTVAAEFAAIAKECPSDKFTDLAADSWYHNAVDFVIENGMMSGVSADKFAPDMDLSRAMIVQILWAMEGKPVVNYAMSFKDVAADAWYAEAVRWAASEGIASGYSAEVFGPNDDVTREQLAVMLYGYARNKGLDLSVGENTNILSYNDALSISEWAIPAMQWACGEGLISGTPAGDLMPTAVATRAQVAVILNNFYNLING